jgi:hypothetical protein
MCLEGHNLELSKLVGIVTDDMPSAIGSKSGMVSLSSLRTHAIIRTPEWIKIVSLQYHKKVIRKAVGFKQIMSEVISAVNYFRSYGRNHS